MPKSSIKYATPTSPWERAQELELAYHLTPLNGDRRRAERAKRRFIAGVMGLALSPDEGTTSILDVGCGPESLALSFPWFTGQVTALDPLRFSEEDEARYVDAGIERVVMPAEKFAPWESTDWRPWDEVWLYNCLQHTQDPLAVIETVKRCARRGVRVFEYTNSPTDAMHLHMLSADLLRNAFRGWNPVRETVGTWKQFGVTAEFYSALFLHRSEDALAW